LITFRFSLAGGFLRVYRSRFSIIDRLSLLASVPRTRPVQSAIFNCWYYKPVYLFVKHSCVMKKKEL
jgi:hypothetical protein